MPAPQIARTLFLPGLVLLAVLVLELVAGGMGGLLFSLVIPVFFVWLIFSLVRMAMRPAERATRGVQIGIWFATIVALTLAMGYRDRTAREEVESAIATISDHQRRTGSYPTSLAEAGLDAARLHARYSVSYHLDAESGAVLFYSQPSMPLVAHHFNFKTGTWERFD